MLLAVANLPAYRAAGTVLAYCGFGSEPDTVPFLEAALREGRRLLLPRIERDERRLALHRVRGLGDLVSGPWGIREPAPELPEVGAEEADFVLVPGVAFDARGGRLGYGGGFYDVLLGGLSERPPLVAAAFEVQVVEKVPTEAHDVLVDLVVTETGPVRS